MGGKSHGYADEEETENDRIAGSDLVGAPTTVHIVKDGLPVPYGQ
ncbi:hypothetical protein C7410_101471 [Paraburkholderia silvatlantica]|uniref:Uncharacterized protein n=1 Tax=Paraburkholderia silvatlantica TaxID=321895 RepID=A0A2V4TRZ8_9BURK|nr:hypothetical protein [Paraburkholderia silvatlantica]PYE28139.1 hypothetical protein C7410_101471 [Paraburkholderia silvatlantica]